MARKSSPLGCGLLALIGGCGVMSRCGGSSDPASAPAPAYQPTSVYQPTAQELAFTQKRLQDEALAKQAHLKRQAIKDAERERQWQAHLKRQQAKEAAEDKIADAQDDKERALEHQQEVDTQRPRIYQQQFQAQQPQYQQPASDYNDSGRGDYSSGSHVGPRGGVYHYSASGKKVYEKR